MTGLRQQIGNFPGVTVEKKSGNLKFNSEEHIITDFPGVYSIYPRSKDEEVVYNVLTNKASEEYPDIAIYVADASNLERNLLFFSQLYDLKTPLILVLNMTDIASKRGISIDEEKLRNYFPDVPIITTNARVGLGKERILTAVQEFKSQKRTNPILESYVTTEKENTQEQAQEATLRFKKLKAIVRDIEQLKKSKTDTFSRKIDRIIVHPFWGYFIFLSVLLVIFQFIFSFASFPMDFIDGAFGDLSSWISDVLPSGMLNDLISQGIIPGIGGVVVFIPQIALLFFFISIMDESGYLARVVFIMDRIMRPLGLNGKSVVPLISSSA